MQSETKKTQKVQPGENLIYRAEVPAKNMEDITKREKQLRQTEGKSNLAEFGDSIKHKFTEGVEAVKELIHEAKLKVTGAEEEIHEQEKSPAERRAAHSSKIELQTGEQELEEVPENYVAFQRPRYHKNAEQEEIHFPHEKRYGALNSESAKKQQAMKTAQKAQNTKKEEERQGDVERENMPELGMSLSRDDTHEILHARQMHSEQNAPGIYMGVQGEYRGAQKEIFPGAHE
ncbi:hypothetical protein FGO68_gene7115 [Halteria grandinella]|uniref:Uncharacterized protein n=1 Tax=Halteria grandinella TaxID=5974 RepID=A0A8J8NIU2_HALGN|nr:hypothetical protein FGO68_gene7115 [Halteria grandinella]